MLDFKAACWYLKEKVISAITFWGKSFMLTNSDDLIKALRQEPWAVEVTAEESFWPMLIEWVEEHVLSEFLRRVTGLIDELVEINPDLSQKEIFEKATQFMVDFLGAHSASIRVYDPFTEQMLSYGSYPFGEEHHRSELIPLEGSIAGEVVRTRQPCLVPDLLNDDRYLDKESIGRKNVHSMMGIPLEITRFFPDERDTIGVIQIYFVERNRTFHPLEIQMAMLMARRLSFVMAKKKILFLQRTNEKKAFVTEHIFRALGTRGGIKLKEIFNRVVPELADMVNLQSCALFSVTEDLTRVVLEAGFPESGGYHTIGKSFAVSSEPAFEVLLNLRGYDGDSIYETLNPSYLLVVDPRRSMLISDSLKRFAQIYNINSILYIPLRVNGNVTHFMTFDALEQRQRYREDEIDLLIFMGRELMKAQRMERLDDALHDFKNPAIATAGFARRLKRMVEEDPVGSRDQILKYADILLEETSRLQELALSIYHVGQEQVVNLTDVLRRRFEINREAIREQLRQNITLKEGPFDPSLKVKCFLINLERVFDNILNNATKAIPLRGGTISISTYSQGDWACAEVSNTGEMSNEDRASMVEGGAQGRGLYITNRIVKLLRGKVEVTSGNGTTTFSVYLPAYSGTD